MKPQLESDESLLQKAKALPKEERDSIIKLISPLQCGYQTARRIYKLLETTKK